MGSRGDLQAKIDLNTNQKLGEIDQSMGGEAENGRQIDRYCSVSFIVSFNINAIFPFLSSPH